MAAVSRARRRPTAEEPSVRQSGSAGEVRFADAGEVTDLAKDMKQKLLDCLDYGHSWRPWTANEVRDKQLGHYFERTARCSSCRGTRTETLDEYGEVILTRYTRPDGYGTRGLGRVAGKARGALRLESMLRISKGGR